jgi:hypothetical protein
VEIYNFVCGLEVVFQMPGTCAQGFELPVHVVATARIARVLQMKLTSEKVADEVVNVIIVLNPEGKIPIRTLTFNIFHAILTVTKFPLHHAGITFIRRILIHGYAIFQ